VRGCTARSDRGSPIVDAGFADRILMANPRPETPPVLRPSVKSATQRACEPRECSWLFLASAFAHQAHRIVGGEGDPFTLWLAESAERHPFGLAPVPGQQVCCPVERQRLGAAEHNPLTVRRSAPSVILSFSAG